MEDANSKLVRKVRRELVKRGVAESIDAAAKYMRVKGLEASARAAGVSMQFASQAK